MELCVSRSSGLLNKNLSRPSQTSSAYSLVRAPIVSSKHRTFSFFKLRTPSREIHLLQPLPCSSNPRNFAISASSSSSVALGDKKDRLPADIQVKESEEPNCRVSHYCIGCLNWPYNYWRCLCFISISALSFTPFIKLGLSNLLLSAKQVGLSVSLCLTLLFGILAKLEWLFFLALASVLLLG